MTAPEILWNHEPGKDFFGDLKQFCMSLDWYGITFDLNRQGGRRLYLTGDGYRLDNESEDGAFACPKCGRTEFDVVEGDLVSKAVLGLLCRACETYGIVCPQGL